MVLVYAYIKSETAINKTSNKFNEMTLLLLLCMDLFEQKKIMRSYSMDFKIFLSFIQIQNNEMDLNELKLRSIATYLEETTTKLNTFV